MKIQRQKLVLTQQEEAGLLFFIQQLKNIIIKNLDQPIDDYQVFFALSNLVHDLAITEITKFELYET